MAQIRTPSNSKLGDSIVIHSRIIIMSTPPPTTTTADELGVLRWVNLLSFAVNVFVTYGVGVAGLFGLQTNTAVSEKYPTLVTPSGYAFAIWGIIFLMQGVWCLQQFVNFIPGVKPLSYQNVIAAVGYNYAFVVLAQVMWTVSFGNEWILPSTIIMLILLSNLLVICVLQLRGQPHTYLSYALAKFPFMIHFGWILVASIVNINVAMTRLESSDIKFYAGAVAGLALLVLCLMLLILGSGYFGTIPLVAIWGLVAVYNMDQSALMDTYSEEQLNVVKYGSLASAGLIGLVAVAQGVRKTIKAKGRNSNNASAESSEYRRI